MSATGAHQHGPFSHYENLPAPTEDFRVTRLIGVRSGLMLLAWVALLLAARATKDWRGGREGRSLRALCRSPAHPPTVEAPGSSNTQEQGESR